MVIQRVQTLYLILSIAFMTVFFFLPFGYIQVFDAATEQVAAQPLTGLSTLGFIIPTAVAILFALIAIFCFKALPTQKLFVCLAAIVSLAEVVMVIYVLCTNYLSTDPAATDRAIWGGGGIFLILAIIADIAAYRGIARDQRLLSSYNRLR